jgi:hypothetical protein
MPPCRPRCPNWATRAASLSAKPRKSPPKTRTSCRAPLTWTRCAAMWRCSKPCSPSPWP